MDWPSVIGVPRTAVLQVASLAQWALPWLVLVALSMAIAGAMNSLVGGSEVLSEAAPNVDVQATAEACAARYGSFNWWIITGNTQSPCAKR